MVAIKLHLAASPLRCDSTQPKAADASGRVAKPCSVLQHAFYSVLQHGPGDCILQCCQHLQCKLWPALYLQFWFNLALTSSQLRAVSLLLLLLLMSKGLFNCFQARLGDGLVIVTDKAQPRHYMSLGLTWGSRVLLRLSSKASNTVDSRPDLKSLRLAITSVPYLPPYTARDLVTLHKIWLWPEAVLLKAAKAAAAVSATSSKTTTRLVVALDFLLLPLPGWSFHHVPAMCWLLTVGCKQMIQQSGQGGRQGHQRQKSQQQEAF